MTTPSHGSVSKRSWVYEGKKRTAFAYCFTYEKDGKTLRARGQAPTRDEALAAMTARKAELEREALEVSTPATAVTLAAYAEKWLRTTKTSVAQRTWRNYTWSLRKHILPTLGASALPAVTRGDVKRLLDDKRAAGLGKNSVRLVRAALSALLADAVDGEVITVNVALKVGNGRKTADTVSVADRREKIKALDRAQLDTLLTVAQHDRLRPLWLLLTDTGCRPSEAFAIQWENVDLVARTATIRQALDLDGTTKSTKTKNTRRVDLSARLCAVLDAAQLAREAEALISGREANALVFPSVRYAARH